MADVGGGGGGEGKRARADSMDMVDLGLFNTLPFP